ncbi:hypothetical protein [Agarivorans sp. DSG3-1]|uniref:hypothetical protein n=1 Tax=Agarivorans sp. DSG3-1 TaxID=3342249 RepID=UPI00398F0210
MALKQHRQLPSIQSQRYPAALEDDYALLDNHSFADTLQASGKFAAVLHLVSDDLKKRRSWQALFTHDVFSVLAEISLYFPSGSDDQSDINVSANFICDVMLSINHWIQRLAGSRHPLAVTILAEIRYLVCQSLAIEYHHLLLVAAELRVSKQHTVSSKLADLDKVWLQPNQHELSSKSYARLNLPQLLKHIRRRCIANVSLIRNKMSPQMSSAIEQSGHDPALALFIAFLHISEQLQALLNRYGAKHRDHYYFDLLNLDLSRPQQHRVLVHCKLKDNVQDYSFANDAQFELLNDSATQTFRLNGPCSLAKVEVSAVKSFCLQYDPYISPECQLGFYSAIKQTRLKVGEGGLSIPLFGCQRPDVSHEKAEELAIGFAIASNDLLLQSGERSIEIRFSLRDTLLHDMRFQAYLEGSESTTNVGWFKAVSKALDILNLHISVPVTSLISSQFFKCWQNLEPSLSGFKKAILLAIIEAAEDVSDVVAAAGKLFCHCWLVERSWLSASDKQQVFKLLKTKTGFDYGIFLSELFINNTMLKLFDVHLSAETGWLSQLACISQISDGQLALEITLGAAAPAIVPLSHELHSGALISDKPVLKAYLNTLESLYGLSLFADLQLSCIDISTEVEQAEDIVAFNEYGRIDATKPFLPFGPLPLVGSFITIGCFEAALKDTRYFSANIEWAGLPSEAGGFASHYADYGLNIDNGSFKVQASALINNRWVEGQTQELFSYNLHTGVLYSKVNLPLHEVGISNRLLGPNLSDYSASPRQRGGYYQLRLSGPKFGFAQQRYSSVLANHVSRAFRNKQDLDIPPAPISPKIEKVTVAYRAHQQVNLNNRQSSKVAAKQLFHIKGRAIWPMITANDAGTCSLLPRFDKQAYLYIALEAKQAPKQVSLFFDLQDDSQVVGEQLAGVIAWEAYAKDGWQTLQQKSIACDNTANLTMAGVITLDLPKGMTRHPFELPKDQFWLRVSTKQLASSFPFLKRIVTNCISLHHHSQAPLNADLTTPIKSKNNISELGQLDIVHLSHRTEAKHSKRDTIKASAEFLRHKQRPVNAWDYERMVLEAFPEIYLAKCFPHACFTSKKIQPGHVLLIVVPHLSVNTTSVDGASISANLLEKIRRYLIQYCAPGIQLSVHNPRFEKVQVRCSVSMQRDMCDGRGISRLNQDICNYFDIWRDYRPVVGFSWQLSNDVLSAYIQTLPYVVSVTGLSLIHISQQSALHYRLHDSAAQQWSTIQSNFPWCLPLSEKQHAITLVEANQELAPSPVGINDLDVGGSLILE